MLKINIHTNDSSIPDGDRPLWAKTIIPARMNRGCFMLHVTGKNLDLAAQMLEQSNDLNRNLHQKRLRPLYLALLTKAWCSEWPDPILVDWNWKIMSGQKRLTTVLLLGPDLLDKLYPEGIWIRFEYGFDPHYRFLSDSCEIRKNYDRNRFAESDATNRIVNEMLLAAFKIHSGLGTPSYSDLDGLAIFELNKEGFLWAASYEGTGIKVADSSPVRLALAEYYGFNQKKAKQFADSLYLKTDTLVPMARLFRGWCDKSRTRVDQRDYYRRAVDYMQRHLEDADPPRGQNWLKGTDWHKPVKMPNFQAKVIDMGKEDLMTKLKEHELKYLPTLVGAVRLVFKSTLTNRGILEAVIRAEDQWKKTIEMTAPLLEKLRPFSSAAVMAFAFQQPGRAQKLANDESTITILSDRATAVKVDHRGSLASRAAKMECLALLEEAA